MKILNIFCFTIFHIKSSRKLKYCTYSSQQMFHDIKVIGYEGKLAVTSVNTLISGVDTDGLS